MRPLTALLIASLFAAPALAENEPPVAIRWWGQGMVSIETYWNLTVVINPHDLDPIEQGKLSADLVLLPGQREEARREPGNDRGPVVVCGLTADRKVSEVNHYLERAHNAATPQWRVNDKTSSIKPIGHAVHVRSLAVTSGDGPEPSAIIVIEVDGVRIVYAPSPTPNKLTEEQLALLDLRGVDLLLACDPDDIQRSLDLVDQLEPRIAMRIGLAASQVADTKWEDNNLLSVFIPSLGDTFSIERPTGNTLAIGDAPFRKFINPRVVVLNDRPRKPSPELAALLDKMDASCKASQKVFAPLTANQMNWQPPDGTHTARWNAEHMMGRQLGFFSEIYAAIEPETFSHSDLNPAQMPPEYKPAHPDWDGAEEARQMERANAYVRRFAYLLDGVDLDQPAPGSRWTPRKLLEQMDRHFTEHTANVQKKFELEGWPTE